MRRRTVLARYRACVRRLCDRHAADLRKVKATYIRSTIHHAAELRRGIEAAKVECAGPLVKAEQELAAMQAELTATRAELEAAREQRLAVLRSFHDMLEPAKDACDKVRLHSRAAAVTFARVVDARNGSPEGTLFPYRCEHCPRQPVTLAHYWHISHMDHRERGKGGAQYRGKRPKGMGGVPREAEAVMRSKVQPNDELRRSA